jgi:hypothetical protein
MKNIRLALMATAFGVVGQATAMPPLKDLFKLIPSYGDCYDFLKEHRKISFGIGTSAGICLGIFLNRKEISMLYSQSKKQPKLGSAESQQTSPTVATGIQVLNSDALHCQFNVANVVSDALSKEKDKTSKYDRFFQKTIRRLYPY